MSVDDDATRAAAAEEASLTTEVGQVPVDTDALAYSAATGSMPVVEYRPTPRRWWILALVVVAGLAAAAATFMLGRTTIQQPPSTAAGQSEVQVAAPAPEHASATGPEPDEASMFDVLNQIPVPYPNRAYVIDRAKRVCALYAQPERPTTVDVNRRLQPDTMWDPLEVSNVIMLATLTYCPQFNNHHAEPPVDASDAMRDQLFTQILQADGVPVTAQTSTVATNGRQVCVLIKSAPSFGALSSQVEAMTGLDPTASIYFASDAKTAYCPSGE